MGLLWVIKNHNFSGSRYEIAIFEDKLKSTYSNDVTFKALSGSIDSLLVGVPITSETVPSGLNISVWFR